MNVIVVGCGRVGSQLAVLLSKNEHNVSVIDKDAASFRNLGRDFNGRTIKGTGFDEDILVQAGVKEADVLAAVTNLDNTNFMAAEVARRLFNVPHVISRLYNSDRASAYTQLGLDYVCGTDLVSDEIYDKIRSGHSSHIDTFDDLEIISFALKLSGGGAIKVEDIERDNYLRIISFKHQDQFIIPVPGSLLHEDDEIIAVIHQDFAEEFSRYFKQSRKA